MIPLNEQIKFISEIYFKHLLCEIVLKRILLLLLERQKYYNFNHEKPSENGEQGNSLVTDKKERREHYLSINYG